MGKGFALLPLPREGVFVILSIRHGLRVSRESLLLLTHFVLDTDGLTMVYFKQLMVVNLSERAR